MIARLYPLLPPPRPGLPDLLKRLDGGRDQPYIPYHQCPDRPRDEPVDDLDIAADVVSFIIPGHQLDRAPLGITAPPPAGDEYVPTLALPGMIIIYIYNLRTPGRLALYYLHIY